jgi:hypothetical protein
MIDYLDAYLMLSSRLYVSGLGGLGLGEVVRDQETTISG